MLDKNQIIEIQKKLTPKTGAESFIYETLEDIKYIKKTFVHVGFRLLEAVQLHYVEELGYENIAELAEHVFDIKKSTCYDLINIAKYYCNGMQLKEEYQNFSQSQLIELCHTPAHLHTKITSDMTVQDIRDYKNCYKNSSSYKGIHYSEPQKAIEEYRKDKKENSRRPEKEINNTSNIKKEITPCTITAFASILAKNTDFNCAIAGNNYYHMAEEIFKILKENQLRLQEDFTKEYDEFIYEFYSATEEGLTGVYRCRSFEDKERAIKLHKKKKKPFEIKTFRQINSKVYKIDD